MRRLIVLLATIDALVIIGFVRPLRLASHYPGVAVSLFNILGITGSAIARYIALVVALVALYLACCRLIDETPRRWRVPIIIAGAVLLGFSYLLLYPATSNDLFHYAMEARILWVHHANPFTVAPDAYEYTDPFYPLYGYVVWGNLPSPYGPIWVLLGGLPLLFGHGNPFWTYIGFKLLALAFYALCAVLIFAIVRMLRPGREYRATLLFAWNPLVLMYVAGNGANDIIMMAFALLALWLALREQWQLAFPTLMLATLVKFVIGLLFPLLFVYAILRLPRERRWSLMTPLAIALGMALLLYAPFWAGTDTFYALRFQANQFTDSLPSLILHWLGNHFGFGSTAVVKASYNLDPIVIDLHALIVTKTIVYTLFLCAYGWILWRLWTRRTMLHPDDLVTSSFGIICAYLMLAVLWFQPWYLLWLIPLGALTAGVRTRVTLLFTFTGLMTHAATAFAALKDYYYLHETWEVTLVLTTVAGLPALYIACVAFSRTAYGRRLLDRAAAARDAALTRLLARRGHTPAIET